MHIAIQQVSEGCLLLKSLERLHQRNYLQAKQQCGKCRSTATFSNGRPMVVIVECSSMKSKTQCKFHGKDINLQNDTFYFSYIRGC